MLFRGFSFHCVEKKFACQLPGNWNFPARGLRIEKTTVSTQFPHRLKLHIVYFFWSFPPNCAGFFWQRTGFSSCGERTSGFSCFTCQLRGGDCKASCFRFYPQRLTVLEAAFKTMNRAMKQVTTKLTRLETLKMKWNWKNWSTSKSTVRPHSHRTRMQICTQVCVKTL